MRIAFQCMSAAIAAGSLFFYTPTASAQVVYTVVLPAEGFGSDSYTGVIASSLAAVRAFCGELDDDSYKVDCLAERLGDIARNIPKGSDYAEVRQILKDTSDQLADLVRANRDPNGVRGRAVSKGENPVTTSRRLTPVDPGALADVNRQASTILDNTQTLLLRSAESTESKALQYSRIAEALGSSKVLLRST